MKFTLLILVFLYITQTSVAQQYNINLNHTATQWLDRQLNTQSQMTFTTAKPLLHSVVNYDTLWNKELERQRFKPQSSLLNRKIKEESLIDIKGKNYSFSFDPIINLEASRYIKRYQIEIKDFIGRPFNFLMPIAIFSTNTVGFLARASIGKKISFEADLYSSRSYFHDYLNNYVQRADGVVPGQGGFILNSNSSVNYQIANAYISYTPIHKKHHLLNIQIGQGKQFVGDGYRSLLLSDVAYNYPFIKLQYQNKYFQYISNFSLIKDYESISTGNLNSIYQLNKYFNYHYVSVKLGKRIQLGLFEGIIHQKEQLKYILGNISVVNKQTPIHFFAPLIGLNSIIGSDANVLGLTTRVKLWKNSYFFGQYVFDSQNFQAGIKIFDLFKVKNFHFHTEFNNSDIIAFSGLYTNSYHMAESLGHPAGYGSNDFIVRLNYSWSDFNWEFNTVSVNTSRLFYFWKNAVCSTCGNQSTYSRLSNSNTYVNARISYTVNRKIQSRIGISFNTFKDRNIIGVFYTTYLRNIYHDYF